MTSIHNIIVIEASKTMKSSTVLLYILALGQLFGIVLIDKSFLKILNASLNLNTARLRNNRKAVWDGDIQWLGRRQGQRTRSEIDAKLLSIFNRDQGNRLPEYCGVIGYVLKRHPSYQSR